MNLKNKIPLSLELIRNNFINDCKLINLVEINRNITITDKWETEIIQCKNRLWEYNMINYLGNKKNAKLEIDSNNFGNIPNECKTLLIKYYKPDNKLFVRIHKKGLKSNKNKEPYYFNKQHSLFTLTENGCYTTTNIGKLVKLGFNSRHMFTFNLGNLLFEELYYNPKLLPNITRLPSKYSKYRSEDEIRNKIDPNNKFNNLDIQILLNLDTILTKKSFNKVAKKFIKFKDLRLYNVGVIIQNYYKVTYPSFGDKRLILIDKLCNLAVNTNKKVDLIHYNKIDKYVSENYYKDLVYHNSKCTVNKLANIKGYKRLINKLFIPNFKFTWSVIKSNDELREVCNEAHVNMNHLSKGIYIKIYYKRETVLFNLEYYIIYTTSENKTFILDYIDDKYVDSLYHKSNGKYGVKLVKSGPEFPF